MKATSQCWQTRNWRATEAAKRERKSNDGMRLHRLLSKMGCRLLQLMNSLYVKSPITQRDSPARLGDRRRTAPDTITRFFFRNNEAHCAILFVFNIKESLNFQNKNKCFAFLVIKVRVVPLIVPPSLRLHHWFACECSKLCPFVSYQSAPDEKQRDSLSWLMRTMTELTIGASHLKCSAQSQHQLSELNVCVWVSVLQTNTEKRGVSFIPLPFFSLLINSHPSAYHFITLCTIQDEACHEKVIHRNTREKRKKKKKDMRLQMRQWNEWVETESSTCSPLIPPNGCLKEVYDSVCTTAIRHSEKLT